MKARLLRMFKIFDTLGMLKIPNFAEDFRVGIHVGKCIFKCKYFVIMFCR